MSFAPPQAAQNTSEKVFTFQIDPLTQFSGPCTIIKQPVEVTCFSYDKQRKLHHDTSSMKYYYPSKLGEDLEAGFDEFIKHEEIDEHLDGLLNSLQHYEESSGKEVKVDIVTWRGMMTKIMTTPFSREDSWKMNAIKLKDVIYIEEEFDAASRRASGREHALAMYAGYKFEEISTLTKTWDESTRSEIESRPHNVVDNIQQYCSVVKTQIGSSTILMGGEVDCLWDYKPEPPENPVTHYLELKTTRELLNPRAIATFEQQKLLKFWAQSFLLGVPKIIVGFRSERNQLASVQMLETMKIPAQVQGRGPNMWDGNTCINFTAKVLEFLRETITEDGVYGIRFGRRGQVIEVFKKDAPSFLTEDYVQWKTR